MCILRCSVTCEGTQLHNINSYQFIDSPEWMASTLMHGESLFQVITYNIDDNQSIKIIYLDSIIFSGNGDSS